VLSVAFAGQPNSLRSQLAVTLAFGLAAAGCHGGSEVAGVYRTAGTLQEVVLNGDGTWRTMYGERTSPADRHGHFTLKGGNLTLIDDLGGQTEAHWSGSTLTIGSQSYAKE